MIRLIFLIIILMPTCYGELELLITSKKIEEKIEEVAKIINTEYQDKELVLISVMKGGICLTADLMRHISVPFTLEYMQASSYGMNGKERGDLILKGMEDFDFSNKNFLIIDDIFDSGKTMSTIVSQIKKFHPNSIKSLVLLDKKIPKGTEYRPDYVLFEVENSFVIGYGMDYKEHYRGLPGIYSFKYNIPLENAEICKFSKGSEKIE